MSDLRRRAVLLGSLIVVFGLLTYVTTRVNRPASITVALARGLTPEAPAFSLPRLNAEGTLSLDSLRGRVVVINFWASWCVPCRDEAPALEATWQRYRDRGVVVLGVNVQDLIPKARQFLNETGATYPQVRDKDNTVYRAYGLTGVPETFFISRDGRIVRKFPGVVTDPGEWFKAVDEALRR
ncbi:MAG: TlpA disulfide reductase family protein [Armatimonadota bacterium]|nr:TlpA disulfide reductase family protein [Armatimonadota bacterium]MDR7519338.1 TlpA disulfide reductase family protein [Armatimonadota bacterium]MDR7550809.1 TlpA disulfide reductase family protein [Armatimonadota bacterium]